MHLSSWEFCLLSDYQQVTLSINQDILEILAPYKYTVVIIYFSPLEINASQRARVISQPKNKTPTLSILHLQVTSC